jgi:hypothetical protein
VYSLYDLLGFGFLLFNSWTGRYIPQISPYGYIMNIQARDRFKRGPDILRKFLADGSKHVLKIIKVSNLISGLSLQPGENFLELFLHFL